MTSTNDFGCTLTPTQERNLRRIDAKIYRDVARPVLIDAYNTLRPDPVCPATEHVLPALRSIAVVLLRFRPGTKATRAELLRIAQAPAETDVEMVRQTIYFYLGLAQPSPDTTTKANHSND